MNVAITALILISVRKTALLAVVLQLSDLLLDDLLMLLVKLVLVSLLGFVQDCDCLINILLDQVGFSFRLSNIASQLVCVDLSLWLLLRNVLRV